MSQSESSNRSSMCLCHCRFWKRPSITGFFSKIVISRVGSGGGNGQTNKSRDLDAPQELSFMTHALMVCGVGGVAVCRGGDGGEVVKTGF